jgi:uncharacterized membrane protein YedE/YeeE
MMNVLTMRAWNPYWAGALAGLLAIVSVLVSTKVLGKPKYLGTSTTFVRASGLLEQQVAAEHVEQNEYFQSKKVKMDWQMLLVLGIFLGALGSSLLGKEFKSEWVPPIWSQRFGSKDGVRILGALVGGVIAILGARLAGGCPSGHGLSGMMQLAFSGLLAMMGFIVGGIVTARLLYKGGQ